MDVSKIRFFKLMTGDFARCISIPEKFVRNFNGQINQGFELKAPCGETWHVGVDKIGDELFLMSGWEDFVKAHELQENDLIVFTCSGNSSFVVLIFEASGCEKVSSLFSNRTGGLHTCKRMVDQQAEHYSMHNSDNTATLSQLLGTPHNASASKKPSRKTKSSKQPESPNSSNYHVKHGSIGEEDSDDEYANSNIYYSMVADRLRDEEKEEILSLASIRLNNPAFVTVLLKKHCHRRNNALIIPSKFAAGHLEEITHEIILRRPNRKEKWPVRYSYSRYTRCFQNLAFFKFARENKLREDDICVFELMKHAKRVTVTVHVIRKVEGRFVLVG
uniref:TF-B3 domain-containing protein n=1 Tax=Arundo donax TaxID=35708 RepID=A0A0A9DAN4_ARUDO